MKKIICILMFLLIMGGASFAQTKPENKTSKVPATQKDVAKPQKSADATTPAKGITAKPAKMKKDGTPDMRHKANKDAAKTGPKLKKDGTPDKRYKANKETKK